MAKDCGSGIGGVTEEISDALIVAFPTFDTSSERI
jgi:hypothetical protein